jgi:hypothetical protein
MYFNKIENPWGHRVIFQTGLNSLIFELLAISYWLLALPIQENVFSPSNLTYQVIRSALSSLGQGYIGSQAK